jgi:hydroxypyruvate reductase
MSSPPRFEDHALHLASLRETALQAADPAAAVRRALTPEDLAGAERVFVVGAGKAGVAMARAAAQILGPRLTSGVLSVPRAPAQAIDRLTFIEGGHPLPTAGTLAAGRALADLLTSARLTPRDGVLALISGGGSALLEWPRSGVSLEDLQAATAVLLRCGAAIHEINVVRQQLSEIKGGGVLRLAHPARVLGLILSDVVGNPLSFIASGPTVPTPAAGLEALAIVEKYQLAAQLPPAVWRCLSSPTSKPPGAIAPVVNRLIASNRLAGEAATARARELGFEAVWVADDWQGEARIMGGRFAELVRQAASRRAGWPLAFVAGGETTVTVRGQGKGGRNQEVALAAALALAGCPNCVVATLATDGVDGPTEAAGAVVTGATLERARALGLDPQAFLDDNNAYHFFAALGDLVITGPTGTNVNDLMFGLKY